MGVNSTLNLGPILALQDWAKIGGLQIQSWNLGGQSWLKIVSGILAKKPSDSGVSLLRKRERTPK